MKIIANGIIIVTAHFGECRRGFPCQSGIMALAATFRGRAARCGSGERRNGDAGQARREVAAV